MRFSVAIIALAIWYGVLMISTGLGIKISDDTIVLSTAIIIAGALAGGDK